MKTVKNTILLAMILLGTGAPGLRAQTPPGAQTVAHLRGIYQTRLAEVEQARAQQAREASLRYRQGVASLMEQTQQAGDLDPLLALRAHLAGFDAAPTATVPPVPEAPPALAAIQQDYHKAQADAAERKQTATAELVQAYVSRLEGLRREHIARNQMEWARACHAEIETVRASDAGRLLPAPPAGPPGALPGWPIPSRGLVFFWRDAGLAVNGVGPDGRTARKFELKAEGEVNLGPRLRFNGGRLTVEDAGRDLRQACMKSDELTLLVRFKPENLEQSGPSRIVSFSTDSQTRNFTLGQERDRLILRLRTSRSKGDSTQVELARLEQGREHAVHLSYQPGKLRLILDGVERECPPMDGDFSNWNDHHLVLGNELRADRPWRGELHRVAIYARVVEPGEIR